MISSKRFYNKYRINDKKEYCNHFKFLTIEEIRCKKFPYTVHSGLVTFVGTLFTEKDKSEVFARNIPLRIKGVPYLENVSLRLLPDLFNDNYNKKRIDQNEYLPIKGTYQIQGEVVLVDKENPEQIPITSTELTSRIKYEIEQRSNDLSIWDYPDILKARFEPAVRVYYIRPVDQPLELIESYLELRLLKKL